MGFRLLPTDHRFFELFADAASNVAVCARALRDVVTGEVKGIDALIDCERKGDDITRDILQRLNTSFVTPFDREDIHALAEELDDVVDDVLEVGHRLVLGDDRPAIPELLQQADLLVAMSDDVNELVARLEAMRGIQPFLDSVDRLESEGDAVFRNGLQRLFGGELEAIAALRWKDIVEAMEAALNTLEDASNVVESIVLKHA